MIDEPPPVKLLTEDMKQTVKDTVTCPTVQITYKGQEAFQADCFLHTFVLTNNHVTPAGDRRYVEFQCSEETRSLPREECSWCLKRADGQCRRCAARTQ